MAVFPNSGSRHRFPVKREFQRAAVLTTFCRWPAVSIVEEKQIPVREHAGVVFVVELVGRIREAKVAVEATYTPGDFVELRRNCDHGIEKADRHKNHAS